jgi:hypothetical protein
MRVVVEHDAHLVKFLGVGVLILLADAKASHAVEDLVLGVADESACFGHII